MQPIGEFHGAAASSAIAEQMEKLEAAKATARLCGGDMAVPLHAAMETHAALLAVIFGWDRELYLTNAAASYDMWADVVADPVRGARIIENMGLVDLRKRMTDAGAQG